MKPPMVKHYERGDRVHVRSQQIWMILVAFVMNSESRRNRLTYGQLANLMGYPDPRVGYTLGLPLGIVCKYCKINNLPLLNLIVVNQETLVPGTDGLVRAGYSLQREQKEIFDEDWFQYRIPSTGAFRRAWELDLEDDE